MNGWNWRWAVIIIPTIVLWYLYHIFIVGKEFPWYISIIAASITLVIFVVFIGLVNIVIEWANRGR